MIDAILTSQSYPQMYFLLDLYHRHHWLISVIPNS